LVPFFLGLSSLALAQPFAQEAQSSHLHKRRGQQHHRRQNVPVVTVTENELVVVTVTDYVTYGMEATSTPVAQDAQVTTPSTAAAAAAPTVAIVDPAAETQVESSTSAAQVAQAAIGTPTTLVTTPSNTPAVVQAAPAAVESSAAAAQTTQASTSTSTSTDSGTFSGSGTFYNVGSGVSDMTSTGVGACGTSFTNAEYICALSAELYDSQGVANPNNNPLCGKKINVYYGGKTVQVSVIDRCAGCAGEYDLDLSPVAFSTIADESLGRIPVTWSWA